MLHEEQPAAVLVVGAGIASGQEAARAVLVVHFQAQAPSAMSPTPHRIRVLTVCSTAFVASSDRRSTASSRTSQGRRHAVSRSPIVLRATLTLVRSAGSSTQCAVSGFVEPKRRGEGVVWGDTVIAFQPGGALGELGITTFGSVRRGVPAACGPNAEVCQLHEAWRVLTTMRARSVGSLTELTMLAAQFTLQPSP